MADKLYLIKEGEISLKGGNRNLFEKRLRHNIKDKLRPYHSEIDKQKGRLYAYIDENAPDSLIEKALSTTSGITGFARAHRTEKDMDAIRRTAASILPGAFTEKGSFRITVKREDKAFPFSSKEVAIALAEVVHEAVLLAAQAHGLLELIASPGAELLECLGVHVPLPFPSSAGWRRCLRGPRAGGRESPRRRR